MLNVTLDNSKLANLKETLGEAAKSLGREVAIAINETSKQCSIKAARRLKEEIKVPIKILKKAVKPGIKADKNTLSTTLTLGQGHPIPLKYFLGKVKQTTPTEIERARPKFTKKQRAAIGNGFIIGKYKGHVFKRATTKRGPLVRQNGPSPGEAFEKTGIVKLTEQTARSELPKQVDERIRVWKLRIEGKLRGKQK